MKKVGEDVKLLAHFNRENGEEHDLSNHLNDVSKLAEKFSFFDKTMLARTAARLHDIGKAQKEFQHYIRDEKGIRGSVKHALPGAALVLQECEKAPQKNNVLVVLLQNIIAGHHRGLYDIKSDWYKKFENIPVDCDVYADWAAEGIDDLQDFKFTTDDYLYLEILTRFSMSAVVDADWLDTERAMNEEAAHAREYESPSFLFFQKQFMSYLETMDLNVKLSLYREQAFAAGSERDSFRELNLPTGYGKTFASISYALEHAKTYGKQRIIVALPLSNLTAEMSKIYKNIMGDEHVIEDYSLVEHKGYEKESDRHGLYLATENWNRPFVITTTVQLFESLFSNKPKKLRKIHHLAGSVLILDEYHLIPAHLMKPIFQMLDILQEKFDVTVLIVSATNMPFTASLTIQEWNLQTMPKAITEKVQAPKRVNYHVIYDASAQEIITKIDNRSTLIIVNTRLQAQQLYKEIKQAHADREVYYLTTTLIGSERKKRLDTIKNSMNRRPVVISTQILEAGVDISFEVLYRELAPLPSIIQSTGRCNRYGEIERGEVYLFEWQDAKYFSSYESSIRQLKALLKDGKLDKLTSDEALMQHYRRTLSIAARNNPLPSQFFLFESIAGIFKMIDSYTVDAICADAPGFYEKMLSEPKTRSWRRKIQEFMVPLPPQTAGVVQREELWIWEGKYDNELGVILERGEQNEKSV